MGSDQNEPDSYSLDDMMQRLRSRGIESEPELVTRDDGTQAYRVRKRKRRSNQPHKAEQQRRQRARIMQIGGGVIAVMMLAITAIGLFAYYNSRNFVSGFSEKLGEMTGAEVELTQFRVTPVKASALGAEFLWPPSGSLGELKVQHLSADLRMTSFLGAGWSGEEVLAKSGSLTLAAPEDRVEDAPAAERGSSKFSFSRYRCEKLAVQFGKGTRPPLRCRDVEASFYQLPGGDQLRLNGGMLSAADWPDLPIQRGLVEFRNGEVKVSSLRLATGIEDEDGFADVKGIIDPDATQPVLLDVDFQRFPFELLGGKKVARLFDLLLDSRAKLSFVPARFSSHELRAPFEASSGSGGVLVGGFPFLQILRAEFQNEDFGSRRFTTETKGTLRRTADLVVLEELVLVEKSFLALTGELKVGGNGQIGGYFDVGVAERLAGSHPSPVFQRVFEREQDGFRWTRIKLSGTLDKPLDDLAQVVELARTPGETGGGSLSVPEGGEVLEKQFQDLIDGK